MPETSVVFAGNRVSMGPEDGGVSGDDGCGNDALEASKMALDGNQAPVTTNLPPEDFAAAHDTTTLGKKRKSLGDGTEPDRSEDTDSQLGHSVKKPKLAEGQGHAAQRTSTQLTTRSPLSLDKSLLPPEIWHHVFTFCPPKSLGRLLATSKMFNFYLDPASPFHGAALSAAAPGVLGSLEPNAIWQASRRLFWPQMPTPLRSKAELEMWRLACSPRCQGCGRLRASGPASTPDPRHPGPGSEGVVAVWAFGTRVCAACLLRTSDKVCGLLPLRGRVTIHGMRSNPPIGA